MYTVYIVDDEELVIKSLKASVDWTSCGFEVAGYALSAEEALEVIPNLKPDVIFSDIRMPGMNGLELIKCLNDRGIYSKFIIISGLAEFALAQKAIKQGVFGYCLKPFDEMEIIGYLHKIKREMDGLRRLTESEMLYLIERGTQEAGYKLRCELEKTGIDVLAPLRLMLTVRQDKLTIINRIPSLTLRIGYQKFVYLMSERNTDEIMADLTSNMHVIKGIGLSKPFTDMTSLAQSIQEAELEAYKYFTLSTAVAADWQIHKADSNQLSRPVGAGPVLIELARLDGMIPLFHSGQRDIRHALHLYNDCVGQIVRTDRDETDQYLYSFDQLADLFGDVRDMIAYLKKLFKDNQTEKAFSVHSVRNQTFVTMIGFMHEHFCEDISIQNMSKISKVSANYISQLFRKEMDTTFTEYLNGLRIDRAAALLRSTAIPINEIAEQVGYKDYFYFSKLFKKMTGTSPKSYRSNRTQ